MTNDDGTYTCAHAPCGCRVADDESHTRDDLGQIFCSEECRRGEGCSHEDCGCASRP